MTSTDTVERVARAIHCSDGRLPAPWDDDLQSDGFWIAEKETAMRQARAAIAALPSPGVGEAARVLMMVENIDIVSAECTRYAVRAPDFSAVLRALSTPPKEDV